MKDSKSQALGRKKMGDNYNRRSSKEPATSMDKKLSQKHLEDSVEFNERHARDHAKLLKEDEHKMKDVKSKALKKKLKESEEYNEDHIKKHKESAEEDRELLHKRKEA